MSTFTKLLYHIVFATKRRSPMITQNYIRNRVEHYRERTFEGEYIEFLERYQIKFERRQLFEDEHHGLRWAVPTAL